MICLRRGEDGPISTSFYAELKRRNVLRVAALYLVASWLLLQVADVGVSLLGLPDFVGKTVFLFLALGFVPALIFSWIYEMTPDGLKREKDVDRSQSVTATTGGKINVVIVVMLALAIAVVVIDRLIPEEPAAPAAISGKTAPEATESDAADRVIGTPEAPGSAPDEPSIAVLPFENFSGNPEDEYFSDGLSDTVLHQLAQVPNLKVIARNSSFQFKGTNLDVREVGQRLGVANVLEGSVQRYGDQVRVIAQLVRTADGAHVWSKSFDYTMDDIFALHDAIALAVTEQMKLALVPGNAGEIKLGGTDIPEAYDLLLQAMGAFYGGFNPMVAERVDPDDRYLPMELLDQALALDPDYVDALIAKAEIYNIFAFQSTSREKMMRYIAKARPLVERAIELAPEYSGSWKARGSIAHRSGDAQAAMAALRKAVALNPNNADAHLTLAVVNLDIDPLASLEHMRIARELDPENPFNRPTIIALARLGRNDEAIEALKADISGLSGLDQMIYDDLADIYLFALGLPDETARWAAKLLTLQGDSIRGSIALVRAWIAVGDLDRAERWLDAAANAAGSSDSVDFYRVNLAIARGDMAAAAAALDASSVSVSGPAAGLDHEFEARLCLLTGDYACAYRAAVALGASLDAFEARGRTFQNVRAQQQLFLAMAAKNLGEDWEESAQAVIETASTMPRTSMSGDGIYYADAEAYLLMGKEALALDALEETLVGERGFVPWDSFRRLADDGLIISRLEGNQQFDAWARQFEERRMAARSKMIEMEEFGDIPAPPGD
jgi:TolB-like protein/tetratricopeptide (TPR) repeat protein